MFLLNYNPFCLFHDHVVYFVDLVPFLGNFRSISVPYWFTFTLHNFLWFWIPYFQTLRWIEILNSLWVTQVLVYHYFVSCKWSCSSLSPVDWVHNSSSSRLALQGREWLVGQPLASSSTWLLSYSCISKKVIVLSFFS